MPQSKHLNSIVKIFIKDQFVLLFYCYYISSMKANDKNSLKNDKDRLLKWFRKYHKWPALLFTFFIFFFSLSGIILNHRGQFSSVDINRKLLPKVYSYNNWNLAALKSQVELTTDSILVYGNIGVWLTDPGYGSFSDFNKGFPKGIDNRKINTMLKTGNNRLFAGTLFGLYEYTAGWQKIVLPVKEERIVRVLEQGDSLLVMTRSALLIADKTKKPLVFVNKQLPAGEDYDNKAGLFKTIWVIHSGEIYGKIGRLLVDSVGLIVIIISLTGLFYWIAPHLLKRVKKAAGSKIKRINKFSLKWHNRLGSWAILILLLTSLTGMFLRPPLLIPIANAKVAKIKYSELDNPNPWFDRLRDVNYDRALHRYILATSEGIYYSADNFSTTLKKYPVQPPISVMGITVLEKMGPGDYLVGSFSGIFRWLPDRNIIEDYLTKTPAVAPEAGAPPFGNTSVSGYIRKPSGEEIVFDYGKGALPLDSQSRFPSMPGQIKVNSPISLWNTALEIHTGRIYEFLIGKFYILIVPLTGLAMVLIMITGFFAWWIPYRRKRRSRSGE